MGGLMIRLRKSFGAASVRAYRSKEKYQLGSGCALMGEEELEELGK
jgi:hypothetical protein